MYSREQKTATNKNKVHIFDMYAENNDVFVETLCHHWQGREILKTIAFTEPVDVIQIEDIGGLKCLNPSELNDIIKSEEPLNLQAIILFEMSKRFYEWYGKMMESKKYLQSKNIYVPETSVECFNHLYVYLDFMKNSNNTNKYPIHGDCLIYATLLGVMMVEYDFLTNDTK